MFCIFVVLPSVGLAQTFERVISGVPFEHDGEPLAYPFFGGLDNFLPQFLDLDNDGDLDLFVLKPFLSARDRRLEGRLTFFENTGDAQFYRFEFRTNFYEDLEVGNWFWFLDSDADGDLDLYHDNGAGGLMLHRNVGTRTQAHFVLAVSTVLDANNQKVANEFSSIPTFADIDGDDDFDFFTGLSTGTIVFYRNVGTASTPRFAFETNRWQDLVILSIGASASQWFVHGSNIITFEDLDKDGDQDFFYGDFFHKSMYHLRNDGDAREAKIAVTDTLWPPPRPVSTRGYNAPRFADLDADGFADFFVAALNHNRRHFFYYRNEGNSSVAEFRFQTDDFLSHFDAGGNCAPALADLDDDGDLDLTVGALEGDLLFFENFGTANAPAFRDAPQKFPHLRINGYVAAPAFVDIDADSDYDLFVGAYSGAIVFFENQGTPQAPKFVLVNPKFEGIAAGLSSSPYFADLDHDGDFDLIVGEIDKGTVTFYENVGSAVAPRFLFKTEFLPEDGTTDSKPVLHDWNRDGIVDLFIGGRNGRVLYYQGVSPQFSDTFVLVQSEFSGLHVGAASAPAFGDLNGDGAEDLLLGEEAGGLNFYLNRTNVAVANLEIVPSSFSLAAYPNPFREEVRIIIRTGSSREFIAPRATIYNLLGEFVAELPLRFDRAGIWHAQWHAAQTHCGAGIYFLHVRRGPQQITQKILLVQ